MNELISLITRQTIILFANVEETMKAIDERQLDKAGSWGWPLGEQLYHLLHSLDLWFINPYDYTEPASIASEVKSSSGTGGGRFSKGRFNVNA